MLNKFSKLTIPSVLLLAGLGVASINSYAKPEYTKKEKKACVYCHVGAAKKELNEVGKCYAAHDHSLATCAAK